RDIPPLDYPLVYRLKEARPDLPVAINGGIRSIAEARAHLEHVDGVMLGRVAYHEPEILLAVDREIFGSAPPVSDAFEAVAAFEPYIAARLAEGTRLHTITRHMLGLFAGRPGARAWRRHLATEATRPGAGLHTLREALAHVTRSDEPLASVA
ncbi:MAG: tRNA-dihydrouridine synthase, partial [Microvirga sp.]